MRAYKIVDRVGRSYSFPCCIPQRVQKMEAMMERNDDRRDDHVIELGAASIETKGPPAVDLDTHGGSRIEGLSDD